MGESWAEVRSGMNVYVRFSGDERPLRWRAVRTRALHEERK